MNALHAKLGGLALIGAITLLPTTASAWWACPSGTTIQLRNSNTEVRCLAPTEYRNHDACPLATAFGATVGTVIRRDHVGNHDKCVGYLNNSEVTALNPTCNSAGAGYMLQRRSNPDHDRCQKPGGQSAPNVKR